MVEVPRTLAILGPEVRQEYIWSISLLAAYLEKLQVRAIVDHALSVAPQATLSHGDSVTARLLALFFGEHRLYPVDKRLQDVDLAGILQREGLTASQFNDTRLGWTLDAL